MNPFQYQMVAGHNPTHWTVAEQLSLLHSLNIWLDKLNSKREKGTLHLYAFAASKLEYKDIRDVAHRVRWMLDTRLSNQSLNSDSLKEMVTLISQNTEQLDLSGCIVSRYMEENDLLFTRAENRFKTRDFSASKQTLILLRHNLALALAEMKTVAKTVSCLPRLPVTMNLALADILLGA